MSVSMGGMHTAAGRDALDRLYARHAMAGSYIRGQTAAPEEASANVAAAGDVVELSGFAPKPLEQSMFRAALRTADKLGSGTALSAEETNRLKTDPAFASATAMFSLRGAASAAANATDARDPGAAASVTLGDLTRQVVAVWPRDVGSPAAADLGELSRRLTQRLAGADAVSDGEALQARRRELSDLSRAGGAVALAAAFAADAA